MTGNPPNPQARHGTGETRAARRRSRRDAAHEAAWKAFCSEPFDRVTLDSIAREAGMTRSALITQVGRKEELYRECLERATGELVAALRAEVSGGDPRRRLRAVLTAFPTFADEHADAWHLIERQLFSSGRFAEESREMRAEIGEAMSHLVLDGPPQAEHGATVAAMLGALRAITSWRRRRQPQMSAEELIAQLEEITWRGLAELLDEDTAP